MRATVGQPGHARRVQQHLADGVVVALGVVEEREHQQVLHAVLEHHVVEQVERHDPRGLRHRRDRSIRRGLVDRRITQRVQTVERALHELEEPVEQHRRVGGDVGLGQDLPPRTAGFASSASSSSGPSRAARAR